MAMMEEEAVRKRKWLTPAEFGEVYAICKLLPGPVATQMAISLGRVRGGTSGGLVAGMLFILPSFVLVLVLSYFYVTSGVVQGAGAVLSGLQAAALAIILFSTWALGRAYRSRGAAWIIAAVSAVVVYAQPRYEPLVIFAFGFYGAWRVRGFKARAWFIGPFSAAWLLSSRKAVAAIGAASADPSVISKLFWMCFKAGFLVFGTGLAVVPVLEGDAVTRYGWLTHSQFMDGLAVGQVTPGPVVITSTFIGYLAGRIPGALAATFGMFLPAFFNVLFLVPRIWKRLSGTAGARGFSEFAIPAVIGGILGTAVRLGLFTLTSWQTAVIFVASLAVSVWLKPPAWILIPVAGLAGALLG